MRQANLTRGLTQRGDVATGWSGLRSEPLAWASRKSGPDDAMNQAIDRNELWSTSGFLP
jgi:hypothetical protein